MKTPKIKCGYCGFYCGQPWDYPVVMSAYNELDPHETARRFVRYWLKRRVKRPAERPRRIRHY
jgi:hypothetical protein